MAYSPDYMNRMAAGMGSPHNNHRSSHMNSGHAGFPDASASSSSVSASVSSKGMNTVMFCEIPDKFIMSAHAAPEGIKGGLKLSLKNIRTQRYYATTINYQNLSKCNCYLMLKELLETFQDYMASPMLMASRTRIIYTTTAQAGEICSKVTAVKEIPKNLSKLKAGGATPGGGRDKVAILLIVNYVMDMYTGGNMVFILEETEAPSAISVSSSAHNSPYKQSASSHHHAYSPVHDEKRDDHLSHQVNLGGAGNSAQVNLSMSSHSKRESGSQVVSLTRPHKHSINSTVTGLLGSSSHAPSIDNRSIDGRSQDTMSMASGHTTVSVRSHESGGSRAGGGGGSSSAAVEKQLSQIYSEMTGLKQRSEMMAMQLDNVRKKLSTANSTIEKLTKQNDALEKTCMNLTSEILALKESNLISKKKSPMEIFVSNPSLLNGWRNFGSEYSKFGVFRVGPIVYLRGTLTGGKPGTNICQLSKDFRPLGVQTYASEQHGLAPARIRILGNGIVNVESMTQAWLYLDGIVFVAHNVMSGAVK